MIPDIAQDISRISLRFGLVVDQVCRSLEVSHDEINTDGAWVYCVHGVDEKEARDWVNKFNAEKVRGKNGIKFRRWYANKFDRPILQAMPRLCSMSTMPDARSA